jgi:phosphoribosylanthranilate isomerase
VVRVKICGMTNDEDSLAAVRWGADALGFIFYPPSPRYVSPEKAKQIVSLLPPFVTVVGVFVNERAETIKDIVNSAGIDVVQLHGDEPPEICQHFKRVIKVIRVREKESLLKMGDYRVSAFLLDTYRPHAFGGTGHTFDWDIACEAKKHGPVIIAGGLSPDNVDIAIKKTEPYGVDVVSGVEGPVKGKKDLEKMKIFIERAKGL